MPDFIKFGANLSNKTDLIGPKWSFRRKMRRYGWIWLKIILAILEYVLYAFALYDWMCLRSNFSSIFCSCNVIMCDHVRSCALGWNNSLDNCNYSKQLIREKKPQALQRSQEIYEKRQNSIKLRLGCNESGTRITCELHRQWHWVLHAVAVYHISSTKLTLCTFWQLLDTHELIWRWYACLSV